MPVENGNVPADGQVQETVTRRRIISAQKASPPPNFWEYVQSLRPDQWCTPGGTPLHTVYIYRDEPPPTLALGKSTTSVFAETNTPWNDQEEMEMGFMARFGGGRYRFILKRGSERVCVHSFIVPGAYKNLTQRIQEPAPQPNPYGQPGGNGWNGNPYYDPTARVAETAINTVANQDKQAMEIGMSVLSHAANVIKGVGSSPMDDVQRTFINAMITRLTAPAPDPVDTFVRMAAIMRESSGGTNGGGVAGSVIDKVIAAVVDRGLNPPASSSGPAVSMGAELVRILPNLAQYVTEGMGNYARIMEAQRDALAIQRGGQPGYVVTPSASNPPRPPAPPPATLAPAGPAPGANGGAQPMNDVMTFIEGKIIEIWREPQSAEWAAEETLSFLDRMDRTIVPQLCSGGYDGLMHLFQTRPTLRPALDNLPRLQEFIQSFLRFAGENKPDSKPN